MSDTPRTDNADQVFADKCPSGLLGVWMVPRDLAYELERENARLRAALKHYVDVVESVNDPNSFAPKVRDVGHIARDALKEDES